MLCGATSGGMDDSHENPLSGGERRLQPSGVGPSRPGTTHACTPPAEGNNFHAQWRRPRAAWGNSFENPRSPKELGSLQPGPQRGGLLQSRENFPFINPNFYPNHSVSRKSLCKPKVNICPQSVQRQLSLQIPFGSGDFRSIQT